ncbi:MAG: hypothetical protein KatS3mg115_0417 [Candidatus Poribacteria bacterium]|nr:MAG: hypothetical protein KatS3mg115_0417 [Candidatus Poribacteria bacterium]
MPPGIFGAYDGSPEHYNPYLFNWDPRRNRAVRKSVEEARALLAEAGYPNGRGPDGKPLVIRFDNAWTGAEARTRIRWIQKRLETIGVVLQNDTTDYSRFRDKVRNGNFQMIFWGWIADYPDPENFFFLLYGPNSEVETGGPNHSNYDNPEFNRLFERMENMTNTPERLALIQQMTQIVQQDAPWVWGYHPISYTLWHGWVRNVKPHALFVNAMKYRALDAQLRAQKRAEWNRPNYATPTLLLGLLVLSGVAAVWLSKGRLRGVR